MTLYSLNCKKLITLEQHEIEADSEEEAVDEYLRRCNNGEVGVADYDWYTLSSGDVEAEVLS